MSQTPPTHAFFSRLARMINAGQSRSILLHGNVQDLFFVPHQGKPKEIGTKETGEHDGDYVPLINFLCRKCQVDGIILLVYELNGPVRFVTEGDRARLRKAWVAWKSGVEGDELIFQSVGSRRKQDERERLESEFDRNFLRSIGKPTLALEFLRQLTLCSRALGPGGRPFLDENLLVIIEAADLLLPVGSGDISSLSATDRQRVGIVHDWFSDPGFLDGGDTVVLLAESTSMLHPRVARLPQALTVEVPAPDQGAREHYISWFLEGSRTSNRPGARPPTLWGSVSELARFTAGLTIHALRQLLIGASYAGRALTPDDVIEMVEEFIRKQLGDDVVEFKKPSHTLDDVIGFTRLKGFIQKELLPRFRSSGPDALPGAAVAGPIGGGKTFIFEAVAGALDLPVLVLKNIRSQWFGQTDVVFERLRRVLEALVKVVIFVDEADTQFGGIGEGVHATERRLTGKIQQMMSDPNLRGKIIWLLMTARIHLLSPDIRRPGRVGDLIIPVLDPEGDDRKQFLRWVLDGVFDGEVAEESVERFDKLTRGYSAAAFASLRSHLKARAVGEPLSFENIEGIVYDHILPPIELTRKYQTLQALSNCTRRSLLPDPEADETERQAWELEIRALEARGIR